MRWRVMTGRMDTPEQNTPRSKLAPTLTALFFFAMFMGCGPGLRLINPDMTDPNAVYAIGGVPIIYAWGVFWFLVQAVIVVIASRLLWIDDEDESEPPPAGEGG